MPDPRMRLLIAVLFLLSACTASASPSGSADSSEPPSSPSIAPSAAGSSLPATAVEDAATLEVRLEGGPDWPTEAAGSLWVLAPDGPLRTGGSAPLIYRIDPETGAEQARVEIPGRFCQGMDSGFDSIWACVDDGMVRIDPATNAIAAEISYPSPQVYSRPAVTPDAIWALSGAIAADSVVRIDPATNEVTDTLPLGRSGTNLAYGYDALWATAMPSGILLRIDLTTHEVTEHVSGLPSPFIVTAGAGSLWVLLYGDRQADSPGPDDPVVARIDPDTAAVTLLGPTGRAPHEGDIFGDDFGVWVRGQDPFLARIDTSTGQVDRIVTGSYAGGTLSGAFGSLWTTSTEFGRLWRFER
ncbi:MAG TPA: hypothetical protein VJ839_03665 [Candidatus Limnocylindria bacterium]|nr:hypothetical protein [Candidatus Limnocylindria bacterium]